MSGADLHFAISELKQLEGKRIAKIRKTEGGLFLFKIGNEELLFEPTIRFHLTRQSHQAMDSPDGFVAFLRKNLEGKTAQKISQYGTDRIVEIETKSKERLVFELFRKGNLIFVGEDGNIVSLLHREEAGGRKLARGEKYCYPKATAFELKLPQEPRFGVKVNEKEEPVSYSLEKGDGLLSFGSFSEAADFYYANQKAESEGEKTASEKQKKLQERLTSQVETLEKMILEKKGTKKTGDAIYANFEMVEELLADIRKMKKAGKGEPEINEWLAGKKAFLHETVLELELD